MGRPTRIRDATAYLLALAVVPACARVAGIGDEFVTGDGFSDANSDGAPIDGVEGCECVGSMLSCPEASTPCAATCLADPEPHCALLIPSNAVDRAALAQVFAKITVAAATTIDTTTGAITGGITRAAGQGVVASIGYSQLGTLGVFVFDELEISAGQTLRIVGTLPAVFLVRKTVSVTGIIDASGNQTSRTQAGPGGGAGASATTVAGGCGPGVAGESAGTLSDSVVVVVVPPAARAVIRALPPAARAEPRASRRVSNRSSAEVAAASAQAATQSMREAVAAAVRCRSARSNRSSSRGRSISVVRVVRPAKGIPILRMAPTPAVEVAAAVAVHFSSKRRWSS